jgi:hypothetical protein
MIRDLCIAVAVGTAAAFGIDWSARPELHLGDEKLQVFVTQWCGVSVNLVREMQRAPELAAGIVPIPAGDAGEPTTEAACAIAIPALVENAPWFALAPDAWVCEQLRIYGVSFAAGRLNAMPGWVLDDQVLAPDDARSKLRERGTTLCPGGLLRASDDVCPVQEPGRARLPEGTTAERGFDIGF